MRSAVSRIFETRAAASSFRSTPRFRVVPGARFSPLGIERWELVVLVVMVLVLVGLGRDGIDLAALPFTGWIHP
jgi:hypothetical protein